MLENVVNVLLQLIKYLHSIYLYVRPLGNLFFTIFTIVVTVMIGVAMVNSSKFKKRAKVHIGWFDEFKKTSRRDWIKNSLIAKTVVVLTAYCAIWVFLNIFGLLTFFTLLPILIFGTVFTALAIHTAVSQVGALSGCIIAALVMGDATAIQDIGWLMFVAFFLSIVVSVLLKGRIQYSFAGFVLTARLQKDRVKIKHVVDQVEKALTETGFIRQKTKLKVEIERGVAGELCCDFVIENKINAEKTNPFFKSLAFQLHEDVDYLPSIVSEPRLTLSAAFAAVVTSNVTVVLKSKIFPFEDDALKIVGLGVETTSTKLYVSKRSRLLLERYLKGVKTGLKNVGFEIATPSDERVLVCRNKVYSELGETVNQDTSSFTSDFSQYNPLEEIYNEFLSESIWDKVKNNRAYKVTIAFVSGIITNIVRAQVANIISTL